MLVCFDKYEFFVHLNLFKAGGLARSRPSVHPWNQGTKSAPLQLLGKDAFLQKSWGSGATKPGTVEREAVHHRGTEQRRPCSGHCPLPCSTAWLRAAVLSPEVSLAFSTESVSISQTWGVCPEHTRVACHTSHGLHHRACSDQQEVAAPWGHCGAERCREMPPTSGPGGNLSLQSPKAGRQKDKGLLWLY